MSVTEKAAPCPLPLPNVVRNNFNTNIPVARPRQNYARKQRCYSQYIDKNNSKQNRKSMKNNKRQFAKSNIVDPSTNLFVNYLPPSFDDVDLRNLFSPYGQIVCSKIMVNLQTGESKCFGFVRLATLEQAQNAIEALNGKHLGYKRLLVKYAESKEKIDTESNLIYVKQIPITVDTNNVAQLFAPYGNLVQVIPHMIDNNDPSVYRCYVRYDSIPSASKAIVEMNNKIIVPGTKPIHVRYADPHCIRNSIDLIDTTWDSHELDEIDEKMLLPNFLQC